ncbi:hypothetical protein K190097F3_17030 [Enterocloster clostridioformis]
MTGAILNADNFLKHRPEVLTLRGGEGSGDVFPNEVSRSDKVSWYISSFIRIPHFFHDADLLHEQSRPLARKSLSFSGHG